MAGGKSCIGLTGRMASGKGEAVRILRRLRIPLCLPLRHRPRARRPSVDPAGQSRASMQDIGNRLRGRGRSRGTGRDGPRADRWPRPSRRWVIDGIRNPAEVLELKKISDFFLIGIDSDIPTILARMKKRGRATDAVAEAELRASLEREWGLGEPAGGQQVGPHAWPWPISRSPTTARWPT